MNFSVICRKTIQGLLIAGLFYPHQFFAKDSATVLSARLSYVPEVTGYFQCDGKTHYYAGQGKNLTILNAEFRIITELSLPSDTAAIDFGDINADNCADLIELTADTVYYRVQQKKSKFDTRKKAVSGKFAAPDFVTNLEQVSLGIDVDKDGDYDILVGSSGHFTFFANENQKFIQKKILPFSPRGNFSNRLWQNSDLRSNVVRAVTLFPQPVFTDLNNDGVLDAYARVEESIYYYVSEKREGEKEVTPLSKIFMKSYPVITSDAYAAFAEITDLDSNGQPDLVFSIIKGLGLKIRAEVYVFSGNNYIPDPDKKKFKEYKGGVYSAVVIQAGSRKYLMLPSIDTGVGFFLTYILRSKITMTALLLDPLAVEETLKKSYSLSFDSQDNVFPGFAYADFNNDGFTDFAVGSSPDNLVIYKGNEDLDREEWLNIKVPAYSIYRVVENPGANRELLIYTNKKSMEKEKNILYLVRFSIK